MVGFSKHTLPFVLLPSGSPMRTPSLPFLGSVLPPHSTLACIWNFPFFCLYCLYPAQLRFCSQQLILRVGPRSQNGSALFSSLCGADLSESALFPPVQLLFSSRSAKHAMIPCGNLGVLLLCGPLNICALLLSSSLAMTLGLPCGGGGLSPHACLWGQRDNCSPTLVINAVLRVFSFTA